MTGGGAEWGLLVLVALPYVCLALIGGGLIRSGRATRRREVERLLEEIRVRRPRPRGERREDAASGSGWRSR